MDVPACTRRGYLPRMILFLDLIVSNGYKRSMSLAELEEAVDELSAEDLAHFINWVNLKAVNHDIALKKKALRETAGYLTDEDNDFITAVAEAGKTVNESHEW